MKEVIKQVKEQSDKETLGLGERTYTVKKKQQRSLSHTGMKYNKKRGDYYSNRMATVYLITRDDGKEMEQPAGSYKQWETEMKQRGHTIIIDKETLGREQ
jgi:hypothetical protein